MEQGQLEKLKSWFDEHVGEFYGDDEFLNANIELKDVHSKKVCEEILYLAEQLGLDENQKRIAEVIGLYHDIGRFRQFKLHRTYNDPKSVPHSDLGLEILKEYDLLGELDEREAELIVAAIEHHADKQLPEGLKGDKLLYCQLIRDADKIDIYRVVTEYYEEYARDPDGFKIEIELPDEPWYSDEVYQKILAGGRISYKILKTWNDCKLVQLSWVYDMNFGATLRRVKEKKYLEKIIDFLPDTEDIRKLGKVVLEYVEKRIAQN